MGTKDRWSWLSSEILGDATGEGWKGIVIAESLDDPTIINGLSVFRAEITPASRPQDQGKLRHIYHVKCSDKEINELQPHLLKGWYAHFWKGVRILVVFSESRFDLLRDDRSSWAETVEYGKAEGIPEAELRFPTD